MLHNPPVESQVKHKKPVFFVHKLSKELVKKYEAPLSPSKKRSKSNQLKPSNSLFS